MARLRTHNARRRRAEARARWPNIVFVNWGPASRRTAEAYQRFVENMRIMGYAIKQDGGGNRIPINLPSDWEDAQGAGSRAFSGDWTDGRGRPIGETVFNPEFKE